MRITAWFIVEYQGFSASVQVLPWHTNSIFIIVQNSKLYKFIPRYAAFARDFEIFPPPYHHIPMAYDGIGWHIVSVKSSKKSSKTENLFNFTTR